MGSMWRWRWRPHHPKSKIVSTLSEAAPAKLNLALHVRARSPDGYHSLESIFAFVDFGDMLHLDPAPDLSLAVTGAFAGALVDDDNLVLRAARALSRATGHPATGALRLEKRIPVAAGLGGGSADAAATLRLLARYWKIGWPLARLADLGVTLGADVPACVYGTLQFGLGRGERLTALERADLTDTPVLLVNPRIALPTGPVFAGWDGVDRGALDPHTPLSMLRNDLEAPAIAIAPVVRSVLSSLAAQSGVTLARMSGSGATVFALFESKSARGAASDSMRRQNPDWWIAETELR